MAELNSYHVESFNKDSKQSSLWSFLGKFRSRKILSLTIMLILLLALPLILLVSRQKQDNRQHASGNTCALTVLRPSGMAGKNPSNNAFYQPSVAVMGNRIYAFLIGAGGPDSGKPVGDWYNLYMQTATVTPQNAIVWDQDFTNLGGILSSTVATYVDNRGVHVYVYGYNYETATPDGNRYHMLVNARDDYGNWEALDGNENRATTTSQVFVQGNDYRFSTENGPLSGCRLGDAGPFRENVLDRPDDSSEKQYKVLYVVPKDAEDRRLDINGSIQRSVESMQNWIATKGDGYEVRYDTHNGALDIGFIRTEKTDYQMVTDPDPYFNIINEMARNGFSEDSPNKKYLIYYDGTHLESCGLGGWAAITFLRGICGDAVLTDSSNRAGTIELVQIHEIFHSLSAVQSGAPHYVEGAHIGTADDSEDETTNATDVMYAGERGYNPSAIDPHNDDYFRHDNRNVPDIADTGFFKLSDRPVCAPFSDICGYPEETQKAIRCLSSQYGVVRGYQSGEFGGEDMIARGTYVAFLVRYRVNVLKDQEWVNDFNSIDEYRRNLPWEGPFGQKRFLDVNEAHTLWREIYLSQKKGFILGYTDGEFKPNEKWFFGFHGITRDDNFRGEAYNFNSPSEQDQRGITRADFITKLYQYSLDKHRDKLNQCSL